LADDGSVGIRIARDEFCQRMIGKFGKPIVSTSANISGQPTPAIFAEISSDITEHVDYVVKWKQEDTSPAAPSSIIKLGVGGQIQIIRP